MMFTFKNVSAAGLFLFGTTFLWMTASFAGKTPVPTGFAWTAVNVLALIAVVGFTVAAWGVFKAHAWWETVAVVSSIVGLVAAVPYIAGLRESHIALADLGVEINLWMHVLGSIVVLVIALVPFAHDWVTERLSV